LFEEVRLSDSSAAPAQRHAVVVANGEFAYPQRLLEIVDSAQMLIAADGGANWLAAHGRLPQVLIGDMDSVAPAVLCALEAGHCRLSRHRRDKNETDTELALLEARAWGATQITLLGALGGRIDHALANVLLLAMPQWEGVKVAIFDGRSYVLVIRQRGVIRGQVGDIVSLLPLAGDAEGIVTEGLEYPLRGETLRFGLARGVSNVLSQPEARLTWQRGLLLMIHTPRCYLEEEEHVSASG
jgi:thiamine pyrophosphokinase